MIEPGATEVIELDPLAQKKPDLPAAKRSIWRRVLFCVVIVLLLLLLIPVRKLPQTPSMARRGC